MEEMWKKCGSFRCTQTWSDRSLMGTFKKANSVKTDSKKQ